MWRRDQFLFSSTRGFFLAVVSVYLYRKSSLTVKHSLRETFPFFLYRQRDWSEQSQQCTFSLCFERARKRARKRSKRRRYSPRCTPTARSTSAVKNVFSLSEIRSQSNFSAGFTNEMLLVEQSGLWWVRWLLANALEKGEPVLRCENKYNARIPLFQWFCKAINLYLSALRQGTVVSWDDRPVFTSKEAFQPIPSRTPPLFFVHNRRKSCFWNGMSWFSMIYSDLRSIYPRIGSRDSGDRTYCAYGPQQYRALFSQCSKYSWPWHNVIFGAKRQSFRVRVRRDPTHTPTKRESNPMLHCPPCGVEGTRQQQNNCVPSTNRPWTVHKSASFARIPPFCAWLSSFASIL